MATKHNYADSIKLQIKFNHDFYSRFIFLHLESSFVNGGQI